MPYINPFKPIRETVWSLWETDDSIPDIVGDKFIKRPVAMNEIKPGQSAYLTGWITTPERTWWAMQGDRFDIVLHVLGIIMGNDRENHDEIEDLAIALLESLRVDLKRGQDGGPEPSRLRTEANVITYSVEEMSFGYFEDLDFLEGANYVELSFIFTIQNPNIA